MMTENVKTENPARNKGPDRVTTIKFPAELHRLLRMAAAADDTTVQQFVVDAVRAALDEREGQSGVTCKPQVLA